MFHRLKPGLHTSFQHVLQLLHALLNLHLQFAKVLQDFAWGAVGDFFMDDFLVAVERQIVALRGDVSFGDAEALRGARAGEFAVRFARRAALCRRRLR